MTKLTSDGVADFMAAKRVMYTGGKMVDAVVRGLHTLRRSRSFIRYCLAGGTTVLVDVGLLYVLAHVFHVDVYVAATVSYCSSLVVNFSLNKIWAFGTLDNTSQHIVAYALIIGLNYLVGLGMIALAQHFRLPYVGGKLAANALTTCWNFFLYKYAVFVDRDHAWIRARKPLVIQDEA